MPSRKAVLNRLRNAPAVDTSLRRGDFDATDHAGGSGETTILEWKANQPVALRHGEVYDVTPVATETYTLDGTAGNTETVTLSHDLIDSDVTDPDVVAFSTDTGDRLAVSNVDYANDTVDVDDGGETGVDANIYYAVGTQAAIRLYKVSPGGSSERLVSHDVSLINQREVNRDPLEFDLDASPFQPVVPTNWTLEWRLDGPFSAEFTPDPLNFIVTVPIRRARVSEIEGLGKFTRLDSAGRV